MYINYILRLVVVWCVVRVLGSNQLSRAANWGYYHNILTAGVRDCCVVHTDADAGAGGGHRVRARCGITTFMRN